MMFFELRRQDLKITPWASPRGPQFSSFSMRHLHTTKKHHTLSCMVLFVELRRQDLNLRSPTSSEKAVCAYQLPTLHFVQRGRWCRQLFRSFPKEKRFPFLHGRLLSFPLVSQHTPCFFAFGCSLLLSPAAVAPKAPQARRSHSLNKKNTMLSGAAS